MTGAIEKKHRKIINLNRLLVFMVNFSVLKSVDISVSRKII